MNPDSPTNTDGSPLLEVLDLKVHFPVQPGIFGAIQGYVKAVDGVSLQIAPGETLGLVGESGCGKSTLGRAIAGLIKPTSGVVRFEGRNYSQANAAELQNFRRRLQIIFQDPYGSLNPRLIIEDIIAEALDIHGLTKGRAARSKRVAELLAAVGLDPAYARRYPHEFSGGQRQRIGIARALAVEPKLVICDEPVSALDVSVQAQIINLLQDLREQRGLAYLFIAHDLAIVEHISQRVAVMYLGRIVELAEAKTLTKSPRHPYTQTLISAVPEMDKPRDKQNAAPMGEPPSPISPPSGCAFHPRCPRAEFPKCKTEVPEFRQVAPNHWAACHFA